MNQKQQDYGLKTRSSPRHSGLYPLQSPTIEFAGHKAQTLFSSNRASLTYYCIIRGKQSDQIYIIR